MKVRVILLLLAAITELASAQGVKINEIMYAPKGGEPEWIEIYNTSKDAVNLNGWKIRHHIARWYTLTDSDFYVPPDSFAVLTKSDTIFSFRTIAQSKVLVCPALPASFLNNAGDTVSIHDSSDALADSMFYEPSWGGEDGKSLERISTALSPFLPSNWGTSRDSSGGTPGRRNSIAAFEYDLGIKSFSANYSISDSTVTFKVVVVNSGSYSTSPFGLKIYLDYDGDKICQPRELVVSCTDIPGLNRCDSAEVVRQALITEHQMPDACAIIDYSSDRNPANDSTWTTMQVSFPPKSLVVNEIMYRPGKSEPEWVELDNCSLDVIDLRGFTISDNSGIKAVVTNSDYPFQPGGYVIVAHDSGFFRIHPGISDKVLITKIPSLNDSGDDVVIHDEAGAMIDSVEYSPSWGGNKGGKSLERILPGEDSNDPQNWETSTDSSGSTPGKINSVTPREFDLAVGTVDYLPCQVQSGGSITVHATIVNSGLKFSGPASVVLFHDEDGNGVCEAREEVAASRSNPIAPGDSLTVDFSASKLPFGVYRCGIFVNYPDDQLPSNNTKILLVNVGLPPASVVINEIMYAPVSPEEEWLELYNATDTLIDISDFELETHGGSKKIPRGSIISPFGYAVICKDSSAARLHYPIANLVLQSVPSLANSGDWITLSDNLGNLLDSVSYLPSYGGVHGKSLERVDYLAVSDSTNWRESVDSTGATPGMINSTAKLQYDVCLKRLDCPNVLEPNGSALIGLVLQNVGRNPMGGIDVSLEILGGIDDKSVFSEKRTTGESLAPGDSTTEKFTFAPSAPGSYEVIGKIFQTQDQRSRNDTLSTELNARYGEQTIVINEIMFTKSPMGDYFELFNASQNPIDLAGWTLHTGTSQYNSIHHSPNGSLRDNIPLFLSPNAYFVVASDSSILQFVSDTGMVHIVNSLALRNDGDCVAIMDPSGSVVDSVYYLPSWHNPEIGNTSGRSLERVNPSLPSNDKTSWSTCVSQAGGTPGRRNSIYVESGGTATAGSMSVSPNPFSPDGDGIDDFTFISYSFPVSSVKVRVRIFDSVGRLIAAPVDNAIMPSTGKIVWDGRDGSGKIVKFGLYILLVEVTGSNGSSLVTFKKPLVVAKRMR